MAPPVTGGQKCLSNEKLERLSTTLNNINDFIPASYIFFCLKMSFFESKKHHLREVLFYFFNMKKFVVESHRLLGEAALNEATWRDWFQTGFKVVILMWKTKNVLEGQN